MRLVFGIMLAMLGGAKADEDIVLAPKMSDQSLPEKMMVFIPGGSVPNAYYTETALAIQEAATQVRLWVTIPTVLGNLCIASCSTSFLCSPLHSMVERALSKASDQGWQRGKDEEDMFLAGHSLGAVCANTLFQAYNGGATPPFAGLMAFGSYVDQDGKYSVANYPVPVLTLNGELDYGGGRPGKTSVWWKQYLEFAQASGEDEALRQKPVIILPGLNHSVFCPGFDVPGDLKADVDQGTATGIIAETVAAFLHAQSGDQAALSQLRIARDQTRVWMDPYLQAEAMERSDAPGTDGTSHFCASAAHIQAGLSAADDQHLKVTDTFFDKNSALEYCHPAYKTVGSDLQVTSCSHTDYFPDVANIGYKACSKQVSCKWLSSERLAEQLQTTAERPDVTCKDINMQTVQKMEAIAPKRTLERFKQKGRGWCFEDDSTASTGPTWLLGDIKFTEKADCLSVSSLALHTSTKSFIYPGSTYCKLLSPTQVLDWMMTDSNLPLGGSTVLV